MAWEVKPWRPFRDMERVRRDMDQLWDSFFKSGSIEASRVDAFSIKPFTPFFK